jgi:hypothetical protein
MVETTMSAKEAMRLCESLSDTVDLGPGVQNELFALPEARAAIQCGGDSIREDRSSGISTPISTN